MASQVFHLRHNGTSSDLIAPATVRAVAATSTSAAAGGTTGGGATVQTHALVRAAGVAAAREATQIFDQRRACGTAGGKAAANSHELAKAGGVAAARGTATLISDTARQGERVHTC